MTFKTPDFWYRDLDTKAPFIEQLLAPFSYIYLLANKINQAVRVPQKITIPVICVGNITAGGSGKTPTILALRQLIKNHNIFQNPYFLSRGYGSNDCGPRRVEVHDDASDVGDEPILLANHSKTIISVNRYKGSIMAQMEGADCILMDDGLQNRDLSKDISLLVVNGSMGFGNGKVLPSGPLREKLSAASGKIDAVVLIEEDIRSIKDILPKDIPVFPASIKAINTNDFDVSSPYIGFAGLGYPQKFEKTLRDNGFDLILFENYPDHHLYTRTELQSLISKAKSKNARLITTEKDHQRIPKDLKEHFDYLLIELEWENETKVVSFLKNKLGKRQ